MSKWIFGLFIMFVSFMALGQVDTAPVESNEAVGAIFSIISKLLVGKPSLSIVIMVVTQVIIMILRTNWLDSAIGKVKMPIITGVAVVIPVCTFLIANPSASFAQIIADGATLAALQVFGHQLFLHVLGDKKDTVSSIKA
jgi:hypothetical protein